MPIRRELQLFFFLVFLLFLNWPILSVTADRWTGLDLFRILFLLWGVLIVALFAIGCGTGPRANRDQGED
ncbi:MAG: hypothetical protein GY838_15045 [bacterium]|nr:hypothetical protein [bacterium]